MERSSRPMLGVTVAVLILVVLADLSSAQVTNALPTLYVSDTGVIYARIPAKYVAYFADQEPAVADILPLCHSQEGCEKLILMEKNSHMTIAEYNGQPVPKKTSLYWNITAFPKIKKAMAGDYVCANEYGVAPISYQLNVVANLSIQCPSTVDVLFNTTATIFVNSTGSLLPKIISSSNLANLTSHISTSANGSFNLSTIWNTSRDLAFNSTNNIKWTAMYTFMECSTSVHRPNVKQNCEFARKPVTCTTKIAVYKNCENFSRQDISPSSPPSLNFRTNFPVNCGGNYVRNKSAGANVRRVTCQRDGKWSDFPSCIFWNCSQGDDCVSTASGAKFILACTSSPAPCHQNAICSNTTEKIICTCITGYTDNGTGTDGCIPMPTTMTTTMTINTTNNMTTSSKQGGISQLSIITIVGIVATSLVIAIICILIIRNRGMRSRVKDNTAVNPPCKRAAPANWTRSEAYGMVEMPAAVAMTSNEAYGMVEMPAAVAMTSNEAYNVCGMTALQRV